MRLADAVAAVEVDTAGAGRAVSGLRENQRRLPAPLACAPPSPVAKPSSTLTASLWLGWFGSGMYVLKRTESKRGGGTISATSRSAGTCGSRAYRDSGVASAVGPVPEAAVEVDTLTHSTGRATLPICDACSL